MIFYYTDKSATYIAIIREPSSCSRWEKTQGPVSDTMQRETLEYTTIKEISPTNLSLKSSEYPTEEAKRVWKTEVWRTPGKIMPFKSSVQSSSELIETEATIMGPTEICTRFFANML